MRYFFFACLLAIVLVIGFAGFRGDKFSRPPILLLNDMNNQAKVKPQASNAFFADGVGSRKPVVATVPMGLAIASVHERRDGFRKLLGRPNRRQELELARKRLRREKSSN